MCDLERDQIINFFLMWFAFGGFIVFGALMFRTMELDNFEDDDY